MHHATMLSCRRIKKLIDCFKEVEASLTSNLWEVASNGSQWVHLDAVITTTQDYSSLHFITIMNTAKGYVTITVSPSVNGRDSLVGLNDGWVTRHFSRMCSRMPEMSRSSCYKFFRAFSCNPQWDFLYPIVVGVIWFVSYKIHRGTFKNQSGK